ncbi:hypothetical protein MMC30_005610 [Trapelia coarctata]|nr:hypothetical protein [Trapelia coarctata]
MSFTASYAFPQWFTNRIIAVRATSEPKKGPELLLRVLTVRPWHAQIFYAVLHGRIDTIKRLFEKGEASVYDVSDHGGSLLTNAIRQGCVSEDTILFLINAGADTEQEDQRQCSPYVLWWSNRLTSRSPTPHSRLELFGAIPEPGDLGLQDLHASVLGLGTKAFDLVLRNTPRSKVNEPDRIGRTALHLAAQLGNVSMVEGLLMKGADPNLEDHIGYMPLGLWADQNPMQNCSHEQFEGVCGHMLDLLGTQEAVNHVNCYGSLVSHHVLFFDAGIIAALEKLKSLGADFAENGDTEHSLISQAVMSNKNVSHVIPWLLANGCDISRPSLSHGTTPTMTAVIYTRHEALELLLHRGSDYALLNNDQGSILHLAAAGADQKILEVLCQHSLERLSLDAKRSDGWTPIKLARWRRDNNIEWSELVLRAPDEDPLQWYDAFKALYRHIAESQGLAYPEELDEERITEAIEGEVGNDLVVTLNEGEAAPQLQMPGSYPDN